MNEIDGLTKPIGFAVLCEVEGSLIRVTLPSIIPTPKGDYKVPDVLKKISLKTGGDEKHRVIRDVRSHIRKNFGLLVSLKDQGEQEIIKVTYEM